MPTPAVPPEEIARRVRAYQDAVAQGYAPIGVVSSSGQQGAVAVAAERLGISRQPMLAAVRKHEMQRPAVKEEITLPQFVPDNIDVEEILDQMERDYVQRRAAANSRKWFKVRVNVLEPIAINWFGDPHLGSNGVNVPLMRYHIRIAKQTPGMYAGNLGDTVDGWGGRLIKLYAENNISKERERLLARWFLRGSGLRWLVWLHGNHDAMGGDFMHYMEACNAAVIPMLDWEAKFTLVFPNGREFKINAAHNHKGHSMWNELHGQKKEAMLGEPCDLIIAGHHHTWAHSKVELGNGRVVDMARARGYKEMDKYALHHQFPEQQYGASLVTVFDPVTERVTERIKVFADVEEGADYLTYLRGKGKGGGGHVKPKRKKAR